VPFFEVSRRLELPPVATYAALNLWNFKATGISFDCLDDLQTVHTFTGTESESWFYLVSVAIESRGGRIIPTMLRAMDALKTRDFDVISDALGELSECIVDLGRLLDRMHEKCDPMVFYHDIRPFLTGSKGSTELPKGVYYDQGNGAGKRLQLRGGSNGQSSLIHFLDIVLGVKHGLRGGSASDEAHVQGKTSFHEEVRSYMPGPHRRFLKHVEGMGSIRELALEPATTLEQERFRGEFRKATLELSLFRNKHLAIVTRYIIIPSRKPRCGTTRTSDDVAVRNPEELDGLKGTGGTFLLPFLKRSRDETLRAVNLGDGM